MKYKIEYIGNNDHFTSTPVVKKINGRETNVGTYDRAHAPKAKQGIVPVFDKGKGRFAIQPEKFNVELDDIVPTFGYLDKNGDPIVSADPRNANDPFFNSNELGLDVKFKGMDLDDENQVDSFWLSVMFGDPRFWFSTKQKRPPSLKNVMFEIYPKRESSTELVNDNNLEHIYDITRYLMNMDRERKKFILDAMFEKYAEDAPEEHLDKLIIKILGNNPGKTVFTGELAKDFMSRMRHVDIKQTSVMSIILRAREAKLFKRDNGVMYFKAHALGKTYKEVEETLSREDYMELLEDIDEAAMNKLNLAAK